MGSGPASPDSLAAGPALAPLLFGGQYERIGTTAQCFTGRYIAKRLTVRA
jgi:hypothetical protein